MERSLVDRAEEFCVQYHSGQMRKNKSTPFAEHPFSVRDILVRNGYDDDETQAISLLHDTIEDTRLRENKRKIAEEFGTAVYEGVYILSKNTPGKHYNE